MHPEHWHTLTYWIRRRRWLPWFLASETYEKACWCRDADAMVAQLVEEARRTDDWIRVRVECAVRGVRETVYERSGTSRSEP